jgi:uncharacterized protein YeaO (DUF488 family)
MSKERANALWLKDAAPSLELCKWFGHDRSRWEEFKRRYSAELAERPEAVQLLLAEASQGQVTLLYSARDVECNQAVALKEFLDASTRTV